MFALDTISFPNLGIVIENLPKSISVFGRFDIAFYGIIIGLGIAMGNSIEELKGYADYVTDNIADDGIFNALVKFGFINT